MHTFRSILCFDVLILVVCQMHNESCPMFPVSCVNGCEQILSRGQVSQFAKCAKKQKTKQSKKKRLEWVSIPNWPSARRIHGECSINWAIKPAGSWSYCFVSRVKNANVLYMWMMWQVWWPHSQCVWLWIKWSSLGLIPARDIVLCYRTRHFSLTAPLSTQLYKWVPVKLMPGVTLRWTSILVQGE